MTRVDERASRMLGPRNADDHVLFIPDTVIHQEAAIVLIGDFRRPIACVIPIEGLHRSSRKIPVHEINRANNAEHTSVRLKPSTISPILTFEFQYKGVWK